MKRLLFSSYRIKAMILRYWFLLRGSWPRVVELIYWPVVQMILWGFISHFMATNSTWVAQSIGLFLGAVLLWDIFFRSQLGVSLCFLEEIWSHNLGHLLITPLRWYEWVLSLFMVSFLRTLISNMPAVLLAIVLFNYSLFELGWSLSVLILNLIMVGWWLGLLMISMVLRYGLGAEGMVWIAVFLLAPISCVYYPVSALPEWLQVIAWMLPIAYIFETMRGILFDHGVRIDLLLVAFVLNVAYLSISIIVFTSILHTARKRGTLFQKE